MKRLLFPIITILLSLTAFTSCSNEDEPAIEKETGEIMFETYVDGELQDPASYATVNFTGGYATGAGKYTAGDPATVAAYPNSGYKLESFTCTALGHKDKSSYYIEKVPTGVTTYKVKFQKETPTPTTGTLRIKFNLRDCVDFHECVVTATGSSWSNSYGYNKYHAIPPSYTEFTITETVPAGTYTFNLVLPGQITPSVIPSNCIYTPNKSVTVTGGGTTDIELKMW